MSLYIGNLSSHTPKDELERVFRRFGQCDIRMKDGYAFVVYEFPPNADKALKALQKKYICGQLLTLSWSKKQPRTFDRHGRSAARYESQHGRYSSKGAEDGQKKLNLPAQEDYRIVSENEDENERRVPSGMLQEGTAYDDMKGVSGEEHPRHRGDEMEDNGRWDLKLDDRLNENDVDNGIEFDRYEPYRDRNGDDNPQLHHSGDRRKDHTVEGNLKRKNACYSSGGLGHKMWNCPEKSSIRRKWSKFDQRGDSNVNGKRRSENEMGLEHTEEVEKKRKRERSRSPKTRNTKRGRRSVSSRPGSSHKRLRSVPKSSKHTRVSNGHSRSHSASSDSRSGSTSHRFRNAKSRSRSNSPASLSLSVSLAQPLPATNKAQLGREGSLDTVNAADSRDIVVEKDLAVEINTRAEDSGLANEVTLANSTLSLDLECEVGKGELPIMDNRENLSAPLNDVMDPSTSLMKKGTVVAMSSSPKRLMGIALEYSGPAIAENVACSFMKPEAELLVISGTSKSTDVSPEELCLVLKHYGLDLPDKDEMHLNPDAYFGSARFWPWETIYYRRLKKGPISIENYARRMEQNHKFGIVDKYVRSSSGWVELDQGKV